MSKVLPYKRVSIEARCTDEYLNIDHCNINFVGREVYYIVKSQIKVPSYYSYIERVYKSYQVLLIIPLFQISKFLYMYLSSKKASNLQNGLPTIGYCLCLFRYLPTYLPVPRETKENDLISTNRRIQQHRAKGSKWDFEC